MAYIFLTVVAIGLIWVDAKIFAYQYAARDVVRMAGCREIEKWALLPVWWYCVMLLHRAFNWWMIFTCYLNRSFWFSWVFVAVVLILPYIVTLKVPYRTPKIAESMNRVHQKNLRKAHKSQDPEYTLTMQSITETLQKWTQEAKSQPALKYRR